MKKSKVVFVLVLLVFMVGCQVAPAKMQKETSRVQPQLQIIGKAVTDQELTGDQLTDWIALLQAGNAASAPFNPYALPVGAGLALLSAVLGVAAKQKSKDAAKSQAKYQAHKQGVECTMKELFVSPDTQTRINAGTVDKILYENIGKARANNGV